MKLASLVGVLAMGSGAVLLACGWGRFIFGQGRRRGRTVVGGSSSGGSSSSGSSSGNASSSGSSSGNASSSGSSSSGNASSSGSSSGSAGIELGKRGIELRWVRIELRWVRIELWRFGIKLGRRFQFQFRRQHVHALAERHIFACGSNSCQSDSQGVLRRP